MARGSCGGRRAVVPGRFDTAVPATPCGLVPASTAVPSAAQNKDDKHDNEKCGDIHFSLLRVLYTVCATLVQDGGYS